MRLFLLTLSLVCAIYILGSQTIFTGKAYNEKGEHIFTEEYTITQEKQSVKDISTKFFDPQGKLIAEMHSFFKDNDFLPLVKFKKEPKSFEYGTLLLEKSIELFKGNKDSLSSKKLSIEKNMVAGHGFYFFVLSKIPSLLQGHEEKMIFLQPNKLSSYCFNMKAKTKADDEDIVYVTLNIDHKMLKVFVPEIKLTIHQPSQQILSYEGLSGFLPQSTGHKKISIRYSLAKEI